MTLHTPVYSTVQLHGSYQRSIVAVYARAKWRGLDTRQCYQIGTSLNLHCYIKKAKEAFKSGITSLQKCRFKQGKSAKTVVISGNAVKGQTHDNQQRY